MNTKLLVALALAAFSAAAVGADARRELAQAAAARAAPVAAAAAEPAAAPAAADPTADLSAQDAMLASIDAQYAKRLGVAPPGAAAAAAAAPAAAGRGAAAAAAEEESAAAAPAAAAPAKAAPAAAAEEEPAAAAPAPAAKAAAPAAAAEDATAAADPTAAAADPTAAAEDPTAVDEFVAGKNLIVVMTLPAEQQQTAYKNQALLRKSVADQAGVPVDSVLFYNQTSMADPRTGQQTLSISMNVECGNEAACKTAGKKLYPPSSAAALGSKITKASGVQPIPGTIQTYGVNSVMPAARGKATLDPIRLAAPRVPTATARTGAAGFGAAPGGLGGDPLALPAGVLPGSALASMLPAGATQLGGAGAGMGMGTGLGTGMGTGMGAGLGLDGDSARFGAGNSMMPPAGVGSNSLLAPLPNTTAAAPAAPLTSRRASVANGASSTNSVAGFVAAAALAAAVAVAF